MGWFGPAESDEQTKREKIRRYFEPDKGPSPWVFFGSGLLFLVLVAVFTLFDLPSWAAIVVAILAVVSFAVAWVSFTERSQRAGDDEIDVWRDEDFQRVIAEVSRDAAFNATALLDPDNPIVFVGLPRFQNLQVQRNHDSGSLRRRWRFKVRVGEDGITRFTPPCLTVLHFSTDHLFAYQCDLNLITGKVINETIDEYFWQDISTLQIERQTLPTEAEDRQLYEQWSENMPDEQAEFYAPLRAEEPVALATGKCTILRLKTTSGGGLEIVLADERLAEKQDALQFRNGKAITRLRKLLRDRKARR